MHLPTRLVRTAVLGVVLSTASAIAQQSILSTNPTEANSGGKTAGSAEVVVAPKPATPDQPTALSEKIDRWVDVKELSFSARYLSAKATDDFAFFENGQERSVIDGRLKLDAAAHYTLNYRVSSGRTFNWSYATVINPDFNTRESSPADYAALPLPILQKLGELVAAGFTTVAIPSRGWEMAPRQLYISATPVKWLTAEYGSIGIERGKGTEITTYDDDGYLTGERLRLRDPKHTYFDEIAISYAYEGDIFTPDFIDRTHHLGKSNYHQFLFSKNFTKRTGASTDYTFDKKTHTIREAAYIKLPETKVLDAVRAEFYQRLNTIYIGPVPLSGGAGFGVTVEKTLSPRLKMDAGYEVVDPHYGATVDSAIGAALALSMNGDSYSTGRHVFTHANVKLTQFASLSGFYIHQTEPLPQGDFGFTKERFSGGLNIDLKKLVNSKRQVF